MVVKEATVISLMSKRKGIHFLNVKLWTTNRLRAEHCSTPENTEDVEERFPSTWTKPDVDFVYNYETEKYIVKRESSVFSNELCQNYWAYGLCPSSEILNTRKRYLFLKRCVFQYLENLICFLNVVFSSV
jgi:hypothetical protein